MHKGIRHRSQRDERGRLRLLLLMLLLTLGLVFIFTTESEREIADEARRKAVKPRAATKPAGPKYPMSLVEWFPFPDKNALNDWEEKVFKGRVAYRIESDDSLAYVDANSKAAASALYHKVDLDPDHSPIISWKWRVNKFPQKAKAENLESREEHDFAARVYVIFPTFFIMNSNVLEYIWAEKLPVGTTGTSPYSSNIKLMVLETGPAKDGEWRSEERDIVADYVRAFGEPPKRDIGAISFMTNAEHTGTSAEAMYDDIKLGYRDDKKGGGRL